MLDYSSSEFKLLVNFLERLCKIDCVYESSKKVYIILAVVLILIIASALIGFYFYPNFLNKIKDNTWDPSISITGTLKNDHSLFKETGLREEMIASDEKKVKLLPPGSSPPSQTILPPFSTTLEEDREEYAKKDAIRVEEMMNYFSYDYEEPDTKKIPFSVTTEIGPNPWNTKTKLLHVGLRGYKQEQKNRPPSNLVFLLDVSGSMDNPDKLPKKALKLLVKELNEEDKFP